MTRKSMRAWFGGSPCSTAVIAGYAALVMAVPLLAEPSPAEAPESRAAPSKDPVQAIAGVWTRFEAAREGDPLAFYYFHGDGKGLHRYGKVGYNNTHSFDYAIRGERLTLRFRKTGQTHEIPFRIERDRDREWLVLRGDPEATGEVRYFRQRGPLGEASLPAPQAADGPGPAPAGHMWIDHQRYATGGAGFGFYQFRPAGIDGRGVGWVHRGDFDDWSTESLVYRITGDDHLEIWFPVAHQREATPFVIEGSGKDRVLVLETDPRDFWHTHRYRDAGPSFGAVDPTGAMLTWPSRERVDAP